MYLSVRVEYAVHALLVLSRNDARALHAEEIATAQGSPEHYVRSVLGQLRRAQLITSVRGGRGGFRLVRPLASISMAEVFAAVNEALPEISEGGLELTTDDGSIFHLPEVFATLWGRLQVALEQLTLQDLASGRFPTTIQSLLPDQR